MKFQVSMEKDLVEKIDDYAKKNYTSRSGFLALCATQYIQSKEFTSNLPQFIDVLKSAIESDNLDSDAKEKLYDIDRACRVIRGGM